MIGMHLLSRGRNGAATQGPLLLIALLSILLRLSHLDGSIWNDETFSTHVWLGFSRRSLAWMAYDTHPPLYHLVMLLWVSVFGDSALSIRALPLLCSAASVFWMGRVAAYLLGPGGGLLAAVLLALSGASIFYAQEARSYSLVILLLLFMSESFLRYVHGGDRRALKGLVLCSLLCAATHVYAFFFVLCFWGLLLVTARTLREAVGLARAALVPPAVAAPFYFLIALLILFTEKHNLLWTSVTTSFTLPDAAALLSFYLFGYRGVDAPSAVHVLSAALFVAGVVVALKGRPGVESEGEPPDFDPPWVGRLFRGGAGLGLLGSLIAVAAPWWLPSSETLQAYVGAGKHPDLIEALPRLMQRTGLLYVVGYLALIGLWVAVGHADRRGALARLAPRLPVRARGPLLEPEQVLVVLPLLAILLVMVVCYFRPTYNHRYMLGLLPFAILAMAVALWRLFASWPRAVLAGLLMAGQGAALTDQDAAYALRKPDYKGALVYVSQLGHPVTGTAMWELENLSQYYADRGAIGPVTVLPQAAASRFGHFVVFEPLAYPLDAPHRGPLRELVRRRATRSVSFSGLTLYELGPADLGRPDRSDPPPPAAASR
jgi:4-amino-4-deoxy-L-arabinose transferase-like glycosyltransferase